MRCPTCKKEGSLRPWTGIEPIDGIDLPASGRRCSSCGETLLGLEEVGRRLRMWADATVKGHGIRDGAAFKLIRKLAGLQANDVAALFDVRPETVSRWERGEIALPRLAAFALGELYDRPHVTRAKLDGFTHVTSGSPKAGARTR